MTSSSKNVLLVLSGVVGLILIGWLLWLLRPLLIALSVAILIAYLLNPLVVRLTRQLKGSRAVAASLVYILLILVLIGPVAILAAITLDRWAELRKELDGAVTVFTDWLRHPISLPGFELNPNTIIDSLNVSWSNTLTNFTFGGDTILSGVTDNLLWALVVFVSLYYFLKDGHRIVPNLLQLVPDRFQADANLLVKQLDQVWGVFLRVQLFIFAVLAMLFVSSTILIVWLFRQGWLPLSPIGLLLLLLVVYAAIQQVDNLWLRPQMMGKALQLHPGVIFVCLITGLALSGLFGALLIVPIVATIKVVSRFVWVRLEPRLRADKQNAPEESVAETGAVQTREIGPDDGSGPTQSLRAE